MPGREQDVRKTPRPSSSKPPSAARIALDPGAAEALVPAAAPAARRRGRGILDGRPVAVADAETAARGPAAARASRTARPGKRGRPAVAVALRAHPPLPDRGRAPAPRAGRVGVRRRRRRSRPAASPPWRSVAYATKPPSPPPTMATARSRGLLDGAGEQALRRSTAGTRRRPPAGSTSEKNAAGAISRCSSRTGAAAAKIATVIGCVVLRRARARRAGRSSPEELEDRERGDRRQAERQDQAHEDPRSPTRRRSAPPPSGPSGSR